MLVLHHENIEVIDSRAESSEPKQLHIQQMLLAKLNPEAIHKINEPIRLTESKFKSIWSLTSGWHDDVAGLPVLTGDLAS